MSCTFHLPVLLRDSHRFLLAPSGRLLLRSLCSAGRLSLSLQQSYRLLQLDEGSSPAQVKDAYLRLAKKYHPDSGAATADPALFARLEEAYRAVLAHQSRTRQTGGGEEEEEDEEQSSRGTALQHRHYLSYEGVGSGTPSQRERRYRQVRVDRAAEQVLIGLGIVLI